MSRKRAFDRKRPRIASLQPGAVFWHDDMHYTLARVEPYRNAHGTDRLRVVVEGEQEPLDMWPGERVLLWTRPPQGGGES